MNFPSTILALLVGSTIAAPPNPTETPRTRLAGTKPPVALPYPIAPMIWEGSLSDGLNVTLGGTIEVSERPHSSL